MLASPISFWSNTACLLCDVLCFVLVRKGKMDASFILFLCVVGTHTTLSILTFGITSFLPLYYFTLLVIVFLSPWQLRQKISAALFLVGLCIALVCKTVLAPQVLALTQAQTIFWDVGNILANSIALSYGMYFFSLIVDTSGQDLRYQADHDLLTGILNRNAIYRFLNSRIVRCRAQNQTLSVIMGDIDFFKQVNDSHGHLVGDEVLRGVAHRLASVLREGGAIGRFGGEEFVVVFPNCPVETALRIAERMRVYTRL